MNKVYRNNIVKYVAMHLVNEKLSDDVAEWLLKKLRQDHAAGAINHHDAINCYSYVVHAQYGELHNAVCSVEAGD